MQSPTPRRFSFPAATLVALSMAAAPSLAATMATGQPVSPSTNQPATPRAVTPEPAATGSPADKVSATLAGAIERYESLMDKLRDQIEGAIKRELDKAAASKQPEQAVQAARAMMKDFTSSGVLPTLAGKARWEQEYAKAAAELRKEYAAASAAYTKAKLDALADAVDAESGWVAAGWDLTPWKDALDTKALDETARTIAPASPRLAVATDMKGEYRLEIVAKRTQGTGALTIGLSLADGSRVEMQTAPGDGEKARVLLTIAKNTLSAQLGAARPIRSTPSKGGKGIDVRAEAGTFIVESVRIKPVTPGEPPAVTKVVQRPKDKPNNQGGKDNVPAAVDIPKNSTWRGPLKRERGNDEHVKWKVSRSTEDELVIGGDAAGAGGLEFTFARNGNLLALTIVRPTGERGGTFENVSGSGKIENGVLESKYSWRRDVGKKENRLDQGSITLKKD